MPRTDPVKRAGERLLELGAHWVAAGGRDPDAEVLVYDILTGLRREVRCDVRDQVEGELAAPKPYKQDDLGRLNTVLLKLRALAEEE